MVQFRSTAVTNTPSVNIKPTGADVSALNIINLHSAAIFVKFYNAPTGSFQDTPLKTFQVAANSSLTLSIVGPFQSQCLFSSSSGLCVRATTDGADSGNTAPATLPIVEVGYN